MEHAVCIPGSDMQIADFHEFIDANIMIMHDGSLQLFHRIKIDECERPGYGYTPMFSPCPTTITVNHTSPPVTNGRGRTTDRLKRNRTAHGFFPFSRITADAYREPIVGVLVNFNRMLKRDPPRVECPGDSVIISVSRISFLKSCIVFTRVARNFLSQF